MMTPSDRARLRALCEAATNREWGANEQGNVIIASGMFRGDIIAACTMDADAAFIAAAKTALPELLGENARMELLLRFALAKLRDHEDRGPAGETWQSEELVLWLKEAVEALGEKP